MLIFGLLQGGQAWAWWSTPGIGVFALGALLIALTVWVERRAAEPVMPGWLWRDRVLAGTNLSMVGMGAVLMGPNVYLPTYGQSVLGLGAIAAGFVLACIGIGWPLASAFSGRVYARVGFRDAGLAGAVLVGVQSTVGWDRRGTVTGANIFSRYLGQTLGAAIFGALFNDALRRQLIAAPAGLRDELPRHVDSVIDALHGALRGSRRPAYPVPVPTRERRRQPQRWPSLSTTPMRANWPAPTCRGSRFPLRNRGCCS